MQPIIDLYSSVYLTAIGMDSRHKDDPFDDLDGERPMPKSLFTRIKSRLFLVISKMRKPSWMRMRDRFSDKSCQPDRI